MITIANRRMTFWGFLATVLGVAVLIPSGIALALAAIAVATSAF